MMNNQLKVSLIIAVYKDIDALRLIINALKNQTYKNFEVVIAEDNNSAEFERYISSIKELKVKHTSQEDLGIRKTRSINNAILASSGDYLIFIDGDCIPYSTFIESHVVLSESGYVVSGRRCNLGPKYSSYLRDNKLSALELEKSFLLRFPLIAKDAIEKHAEQGFRFSPNSFIYRKFIKHKETSILGCNYSCFKSDMIEINGYDEGLKESSLPDDTDLEWRFRCMGLKLKSAKNVANIFHLYHKRSFREQNGHERDLKKMNKNRIDKKFRCDEGLNTH